MYVSGGDCYTNTDVFIWRKIVIQTLMYVSKGHCYANAATVAADYIAYFPINALEARPSNFQNKPEGAIN
jgi:hypothetical protein